LDALRYPIMMMMPAREVIDTYQEPEPQYADIGL
jgi:hypothetical protein